MRILINSDNRLAIDGKQAFREELLIQRKLRRFSKRLTRVVAHFRDLDGPRNAGDFIEARLEARAADSAPSSASARGRTPREALGQALKKMNARLESEFGRRDRVRR